MFPQKSCSKLEELIRLLHEGDQSETNSGLKDNDYLITMMNYLSSEDRKKMEKIIGWLEDDANKNEVEYVNLRHNISIMIAYASCKIEDQQQTLRYAKIATEQFQLYPNLWNQALAFWFLGIVYRNNANFVETKNALETAKKLLEEHSVEAVRKYNHLTSRLCQECIRRIRQEIKDLPARAHSSSPPQNKKETRFYPRWFANKSGQSSSSQTTGSNPTPMKQDVFLVNGGLPRHMKSGDETPPPSRPLRVFLCHSSNDKPIVRRLCEKLVAHGVDAWLDEKKLLPGQLWKNEIPKAVREADAVIICLSKTSITKEGYVQKEIKFALDIALEKPNGAIYLIPAKIEECKVPDSLSAWHWVNLFEQHGLDLLFKSLKLRAHSFGLKIKDTE